MIKSCNMIYKLQYSTPKMSNVLHYIFIKIRKFDCNFGVGAKICYFSHIYCQYCQLGFSSKMLQLGLAWLGTFIARLELENSSSNSSLRVSMQCMYLFLSVSFYLTSLFEPTYPIIYQRPESIDVEKIGRFGLLRISDLYLSM